MVLRPSLVHYNGLLDVLKRGDYRYDGSAWEGSRIGHNYGGETIQGVVPFYYQKKALLGSYYIVRLLVIETDDLLLMFSWTVIVFSVFKKIPHC